MKKTISEINNNRPRTKWTIEKKNKILHYLRQGLTYAQICRKLNVTYDSLAYTIKSLRANPSFSGKIPYYTPANRSQIDKRRIGILDIETSDLYSNRGFLLTYAIKVLGKNKFYTGRITKEEILRGDYDKNLIKRLIKDLLNFDIIIGYYSSGFDIPFIRGRALFYRLPFPFYDTLRQIDLYYRVKYKYGLNRNSLDSICRLLGINGKNHIDFKYWQDATCRGSEKAIRYLFDHNKRDVIITEKLYNRLSKYFKFAPKPI